MKPRINPQAAAQKGTKNGQILVLLASGKSAAEISLITGLSLRCVRRRIDRLRDRLGARSVPWMVAKACLEGVLVADEEAA